MVVFQHIGNRIVGWNRILNRDSILKNTKTVRENLSIILYEVITNRSWNVLGRCYEKDSRLLINEWTIFMKTGEMKTITMYIRFSVSTNLDFIWNL